MTHATSGGGSRESAGRRLFHAPPDPRPPTPIHFPSLRRSHVIRSGIHPVPALSILWLTVAVLAVPVETRAQDASKEALEVKAVLEGFHDALAAGDSVTALGYLADDVVIIESGGVEDKEHYRNGHLPGDMRFARAVPRKRGPITVEVMGDMAWAYSTSIVEGKMGEREINSQAAELAVLTRTAGGWKIKAIHWSSRRRR